MSAVLCSLIHVSHHPNPRFAHLIILLIALVVFVPCHSSLCSCFAPIQAYPLIAACPPGCVLALSSSCVLLTGTSGLGKCIGSRASSYFLFTPFRSSSLSLCVLLPLVWQKATHKKPSCRHAHPPNPLTRTSYQTQLQMADVSSNQQPNGNGAHAHEEIVPKASSTDVAAPTAAPSASLAAPPTPTIPPVAPLAGPGNGASTSAAGVAGGAAANNSAKACIFFASGTCRNGDNCKFSHDPAVLNNPPPAPAQRRSPTASGSSGPYVPDGSGKPPPILIIQTPPGHPIFSIDVECVATGVQHNARSIAQVALGASIHKNVAF